MNYDWVDTVSSAPPFQIFLDATLGFEGL